jgi:hypothetical protein
VAPICSNCGGTDFLWASELKTGGRLGGGPLSLRAAGELTLGTRICRTCGHADLFLKDVKILHTPQAWRPHEFVPIVSHAAAPPPRAIFAAGRLPVPAEASAPAAPVWNSPTSAPSLAGPAASLPAPSLAAVPSGSPAVGSVRAAADEWAPRPPTSETPTARPADGKPAAESVVHLESSGGGPTVVLLSDNRPASRPEPGVEVAAIPIPPTPEREIVSLVREAQAPTQPVGPVAPARKPAPTRARTPARKRTVRSK